jgi:hypothetical protein
MEGLLILVVLAILSLTILFEFLFYREEQQP